MIDQSISCPRSKLVYGAITGVDLPQVVSWDLIRMTVPNKNDVSLAVFHVFSFISKLDSSGTLEQKLN